MGTTTAKDQDELAECFCQLRFLEKLIRRSLDQWGSYSCRIGAAPTGSTDPWHWSE